MNPITKAVNEGWIVKGCIGHMQDCGDRWINHRCAIVRLYPSNEDFICTECREKSGEITLDPLQEQINNFQKELDIIISKMHGI